MSKTLFCPPHADDEVLQMGVEILRNKAAGSHIVVAAASRSSTTSAASYFNGSGTKCGFHNLVHLPYLAGVPDPLAAMSDIRIKEQESACDALGVDEYRHGTGDDGTLSVDYWRDWLLQQEGDLSAGDTIFVPTPWETTGGVGNPDHGNGGLALKQLVAEGHFPGLYFRYTVFSRYWTTSGCPTGPGLVQRGPADDLQKAKLLTAADCYRAFNPSAGSYAIGWMHSVPADFTAQFVTTSSPRYLVQRYHA